MSGKISIILLEDIPSLGRAGQIVEVTDGYARNFLFPQGKAALADAQVKSQVATDRARAAATAEQELQALQQQADSLSGTELTISANVKEGDEIYGRITAADIAQEINQQTSLSLKPKNIKLSSPLTKLGSYDIAIALSPEVETSLNVTVVSDE